ncbi:unnamed protein product [Eruca vesicaria subsp. sativa]|uniref:Late embryogenesis abundant protein n=1 Tax=Eruca vesicaria subsp. sativa TaxID=29727 RepID=A0ABC8KLI3_ERUVS|nr:unnamed protein product [Eruca vesicaria subsp. sativa]
MQSAKQKLSDMASTAKERMVECEAKAAEKAEQAMARTKEEKEIAHQRRKAKEAEAKMDLHIAKAVHAEEKLMAKQSHYHVSHGLHNAPVPAPAPVMGHGYRHDPPGVTSIPPAAYPPPPTGPHHHPYGNV